MGGLLDKAKTKSTDDSEKPKESKSDDSSGLLKKAEPLSSSLNDSKVKSSVKVDGPDIPLILNIAGWVIILVGAILSLQGGSWGIIVVLVVLIAGVGSLVQSQRMSNNLSKAKMILSITVAVLIATGPYVALILVPTNSNIVVTELSINETDDTISFTVRGSFDSVDAEIVHDGDVLWSDSRSTKSEKITFTVPIADIFVTNAIDYRGVDNGVLEEYQINAVSSEGEKSSAILNPAYMTREVTGAAVKINQIDKPNQDGVVEVVGIQVEVSLGLLNPSHANQDGGGHDTTKAYSISSDYQVDVRIYKTSSKTLWTHDTVIEVNGYSASWQCDKSGTGPKSGTTQQTWLGLCGTVEEPGAEYIEKDEFYDDDGCYTFEVIITNELYSDQPVITVNSNSWELEWDELGTDSSLPTC